MFNVLPDLLGTAGVQDLTDAHTLAIARRFASLTDPTGCMPAFGASNGAAENSLSFMSAFERAAAASGEGSLREAAARAFGCAGTAMNSDPISLAFAADQMNPGLMQSTSGPAVPSKRALLTTRLEARNLRASAAAMPDKIVLFPGKVQARTSKGSQAGDHNQPYAIIEAWATVSLYHEATAQIVGDLVEFRSKGLNYGVETGRKHAPAVAQGSNVALVPDTKSADAAFPWLGAAELVPEPTKWQQLVVSTRYLQVRSNDMHEYTTRELHDLAFVCDSTVAADRQSPLSIGVARLALLGPSGELMLDKFEPAGPTWGANASFSTDVPPGSGASSSLRLDCAANSTTTFHRPSPPLGLRFDVVENYTHVSFWWRVLSPHFAWAANPTGAAVPSMPLGLNTTFPVAPEDAHVGEATSALVGKYAGGFSQSWFYPETASSAPATFAAADEAAGAAAGKLTMQHMHGFGSSWTRGSLLLSLSKEDDEAALLIFDRVTPGALQGNSLVGPIFNFDASLTDGPHVLPNGAFWNTAGFGGANDSLLLVYMAALKPAASSRAPSLVNSSQCNVMGIGAASCRRSNPAPCSAAARGGCPQAQMFGAERVAASEAATIVTLLLPRSRTTAASEIASITASLDTDGLAKVDLGALAPRVVSFDTSDATQRWSAYPSTQRASPLPLSPSQVASRAAVSILAHPNNTQPGCGEGCAFFGWGYCGGLVINGLQDAFEAGTS